LSYDLVKLCTCIYCSSSVELIEFLLRQVFRFAARACVYAVYVCQLSSLRCDVTIAARSSRGRCPFTHSVSCWSINSSQASLLPCSVPAGPAHALVALRSRRPFIGLAHSLISRSAVQLYYARLRRYFTSGFLLCWRFSSELKCFHCRCRGNFRGRKLGRGSR